MGSQHFVLHASSADVPKWLRMQCSEDMRVANCVIEFWKSV